MGYFILNGENSLSHGVVISSGGVYNTPERDVEALPVPGRSGDLVVDNKRWKNVPLALPATVAYDWLEREPDIRQWLASCSMGYTRLVTSYHPDEYRMVRFVGPLEPDVGFLCRSARFTVTFDAKPQRWLTAGEAWTALDPSGSITLTNPTGFDARPIIEVVAPNGGTLTVGAVVIDLPEGYSGTMVIDCQRLAAYCGAAPLNHLITDFPALGAGDTIITAAGITSGRIQPRWWRL